LEWAGIKGIACGFGQTARRCVYRRQTGSDSGHAGDNPERNNIGPVGVYQRDTVNARDGYASLKKWEETSGSRCRLVAMMAVYDPAATFMAYARYKGEPWIFSTPSNAAGNRCKPCSKEQGITDKVIATQIVPALDSSLPVVAEARKALGQNLDYVSLEGYHRGQMFLAIMRRNRRPADPREFPEGRAPPAL
jgi:branched-chain amino acid transport system substrate-binding protein